MIHSLHLDQIKFKTNFASVAVFSIFVVLFLILGIWQINRAIEKQHLENQFQKFDLLSPDHPYSLNELTPTEFQSVSLDGYFDFESAWFLKNQVIGGEYGYDALVPFVTRDKISVLVNLGWVEGHPSHNPNTEQLLALMNQKGLLNTDNLSVNRTTIEGKFRAPLNLPFVDNLYAGEPMSADSYAVSPTTSILEITPTSFPYKNLLSDWYIQISPQDSHALRTHWQVSNMPPSKHIGYAIQWFAMAITVFIAFTLTQSNFSQWWQNEFHGHFR